MSALVPIYHCQLLAAARGDRAAGADLLARCARAVSEEGFRFFPCSRGTALPEGGFKGRCPALTDAEWDSVAALGDPAWLVISAIRLRAVIDGGVGFYGAKK